MIYSRSASYAANGFLNSDTTVTKKYESNYTTNLYTSSNSYTATSSTGEYLLGAVGSVSTYSYKNSYSNTNWASTTNTYQWWDGALQGAIAYKPNTSQSTTFNTYFYYNGQGTLGSVSINDGRPRTVSYITNGDGQIIRRDEADYTGYNSSTGLGGDPHEVWYRFGGKELGYVTNNGATSAMTETGSIADRQAMQGTGAFRNGWTTSSSYTNFAESTGAQINSYSQGSAAGSYVVQRSGETLRGIAQQLWGDASLWYKIADANGMSGDVSLSEGQRLSLPAGLQRTHNNAATLTPYDANAAIGNVSPTTPKPPKKNSCGIFGQILLAIIAIAVTIIALPTGASPTILQGALAGLAGGAASQTVGVITGIQDKFNFGALALSAIGGGVGAGVTQVLGAGSMLGSQFVGDVVRGAVGSAVTQGIGVATGLQDKFSWSGVAAAGVEFWGHNTN